MSSYLPAQSFRMEENLKKFLDRSQLLDDVEALKDMVVFVAQTCSENFEYLNSELAVLRRFQFGQRSERLKKNG